MRGLTDARKPKVDRMLAAGTSSSIPYLTSCSLRYRSSLTAIASKPAWKNEIVNSHCRKLGIESLLINRPVNSRLSPFYQPLFSPQRAEGRTHLNSMTNVPTKLATPRSANATLNNRHTAAVVRLNSTSTSMNFQ